MEVGAISVMMYCFRERELLLNINELLAGFRLFPSYVRVGGLREDLPRGFHDAVRAFLERFPAKLDEYEDLLTKNEIYLMRTQGVGVVSKEDALAYSLPGPIARAAGVDYDVRKYFPYMGYDTFEFTVPVRTEGDVYARYLVRVAEMRESMKICRQALGPDQATGPFAIDIPVSRRRPGSRVHGDEALIQHFLIYSQGFTGAGGGSVCAVEGPAANRDSTSSRRHEPPVARESRAPSRWRARPLAKMIVGGTDCRRHRLIGSTRRRDGDVDR